MDRMQSSSLSDIKASNEDGKQDGDDSAANAINDNVVVAENIVTTKSVDLSDHELDIGCHDESTFLEDVKICDICGDAGREDLLAACSKCSDGAEHIYCMRRRLEKVPDSDWICEDCALLEDKDKRRQTESSHYVASPKCNINESDHELETLGASDMKVYPVPNSKGLDIERSTRNKLSCLPSNNRPLGIVHSALLARRRALAKNSVFTSRHYSKAPKSQDFAVKSNHELSSPKGLSHRSMRENADLLTVSGQKFPKSHQLLTSSGPLTKSKSFNGSDRRPKVQFLDKNPENQKFPDETVLSTKGKGCTFRSLKKSMSMSDASSGCSNALDVETKSRTPKDSEISDLKRLRNMKELGSVEMAVKPVLKKPRILSPDGSFSSASSDDKKFASQCKAVEPHFSETKYSDPITRQNSIKSETANADEVKKLSSSLPNVVQDLLSSTQSNPPQELKHKGEVKPSSSLTSKRHLSSSDASGQDKLPALERSSHQNLKAPQSSHNDGRTSDGSGSAYCCKCKTMGHATHCHSEDSSSASVLDMGRHKDLNKGCATDLASPFCYHLNVIGSLAAVPMFNYIWKGEFEIQSSGRLPGVLCRIQAHLSTKSSPKIPEVVKKFSDKILLEEFSRLDAWPTQFLEYHPQDDNIGLYFFAEDIESYSKYKSFLQCMIDYDLALKGNFNGIELLIFSSNLLPEKSQCWNKLLFLWGIFRQRKFITT